MAIVAIILEHTHKFHEGEFLPWYGYIYVTIITLLSVFVSMYFLVWFYFTMEEELKPYSPVAKFICIKAILFFAFWQGVAIAALAYFKIIPESVGQWTQQHIARGLQDFIVCVEMFLLSVAHGYVFSYQPYEIDHVSWYKSPSEAARAIAVPMENFAKHVINQKDVVNDLRRAYSPRIVKEAKKQHLEVKRHYHAKKVLKLGEDLEKIAPGGVLLKDEETVSEVVSLVKDGEAVV